jgi:hypothetical protein
MATPTAIRVAESGWRRYKHTWRASLFSSFVNPVMLLAAMGIGLGSLVDRDGGPGGFAYVTWLAPGLLANIGMQTAAGESAYPVMAGMKWIKSYDAMLASPLDASDIVLGHFTWVSFRIAQVTIVFAAVAVWLADLDPVRGIAAGGAAVLTGMAFIGPVTAYTAKFNNDTSLATCSATWSSPVPVLGRVLPDQPAARFHAAARLADAAVARGRTDPVAGTGAGHPSPDRAPRYLVGRSRSVCRMAVRLFEMRLVK